MRRPAWDLNGLLGKTPFWGKFWENPALSAGERKFLIYTRDAAIEYLSNIKDPDFGLIHADALQENVFLNAGWSLSKAQKLSRELSKSLKVFLKNHP